MPRAMSGEPPGELSWDAITEAGGVVVSDQVRLHLNIQLMAIGQEHTQEEAVA